VTSELRLAIGGLSFRVGAPGIVQEAIAERYARFLVGEGRADVTLEIGAAASFETDLRNDPSLQLGRDGGRARFTGNQDVVAELDPATGAGSLAGARHLGDVDALLRLALSLMLPARGALLVHGAAVRTDGGTRVLLGASGAGKSTAAEAFGDPLSDELVVLHPAAGEVEGTPYWHGAPARSTIGALYCLERGGTGARRSPHGSEQLRLVQRHVARYLAHPAIDPVVFGLVAECCRRWDVVLLQCPEGASFLPFLRGQLAAPRVAP
jgi:hypothetical protein